MGKGYNGLITTDSAGTYKVRVTRIEQNATIISKEAQGRTRRVFYPTVTATSSFTLGVIFPSWESREKFNIWMSGFMDKVVAGRGFKAAVQVDVPDRDFSRTCIPTGPLQYGEALSDVVFPMALRFTGSSDPLKIDLENKRARAHFVPPKKGRDTSIFFYPSGKQISGPGVLDEGIYDNEFIGPVAGEAIYGPPAPPTYGPEIPDYLLNGNGAPDGSGDLSDYFATGVFGDPEFEDEGQG